MKYLIAIIACCLGLCNTLPNDDIKKSMVKAENTVKCILENNQNISSVEELVDRLENLAAGNGKILELRTKVVTFLNALGIPVDDSRGIFGIAVDIHVGIDHAYQVGKEKEVLFFVHGLLTEVPPSAWKEYGKILSTFMDEEMNGVCSDDSQQQQQPKERGMANDKEMKILYNLLKRYFERSRK